MIFHRLNIKTMDALCTAQSVLFKKADFKQSDYFNVFDCPLNRALRRCFPDSHIMVGGKTVTITPKKGEPFKFRIGAMHLNGSLMSPRGLSVPVLTHIHRALRYKYYRNAAITLYPLT